MATRKKRTPARKAKTRKKKVKKKTKAQMKEEAIAAKSAATPTNVTDWEPSKKSQPLPRPFVIKVSGSGVPRFFGCASSAIVIDAPFNMPSGASNFGEAGHDGAADMVRGNQVDIDVLAEEYEIEDKTDLRVCMAYAWQAWKATQQHFPNPKVEQRLESDLVNGTGDVIHHDGETAAVGDWKFGRIPSYAVEQIASYAFCLREKYGMPSSGYITGLVWWLRFQQMDVKKMDDAYLDAFADTFKRQLKSAGRQYAPSYDNCGFCLRQNECQARRDYINAAGSAMLVHQSEAEAGAMTAELIGRLYPQAKLLEKALAAYKDALKQCANRGQVRIGDGKVYRINEYHKDVITNVQDTWKHLVKKQGFTDADMVKVCKLNLTTIKNIAGERAATGEIAKEKARVLRELADDGCISTIPYSKPAVMKG